MTWINSESAKINPGAASLHPNTGKIFGPYTYENAAPAMVGSGVNWKCFSALQEDFTQAETSGYNHIVMLSDYALTENSTLSAGGVNFNLSGHTLTTGSYKLSLTSGTANVIKNGKINGDITMGDNSGEVGISALDITGTISNLAHPVTIDSGHINNITGGDGEITISGGYYYGTLAGSDTPDYSSCPRDNTCVYAKYTDSSTTEWYHDGVHYCVQNGLMVGTSDITFEPNANLSRSMIVTILWRMEGSPEVNYAMSFEDVADGQWYTEAIRWAQSTGIVKGLSDTSFAPDDNVTREQLAAILMRYADYKGLDTSSRADLSGYTDADSISDWAVENIQWANASGIINGRTETTIVPDGSATRAEAASMIQRFCETILK